MGRRGEGEGKGGGGGGEEEGEEGEEEEEGVVRDYIYILFQRTHKIYCYEVSDASKRRLDAIFKALEIEKVKTITGGLLEQAAKERSWCFDRNFVFVGVRCNIILIRLGVVRSLCAEFYMSLLPGGRHSTLFTLLCNWPRSKQMKQKCVCVCVCAVLGHAVVLLCLLF